MGAARTHEDLSRRVRPRLPSDWSFGVVWCCFLTAVGLWPLLGGRAPRWWALGLVAALAAVTWLRPSLLRPLNRVWFALGLLLGRVVTPVVTAVLFFGVFTPMGLAMRLFRRDPLHLRWDESAYSYWTPRIPPGPPPETMTNQF